MPQNDHPETSDGATALPDSTGSPVGVEPAEAPAGGRIVNIEPMPDSTPAPPLPFLDPGDAAQASTRQRSSSRAGPLSRYLLVLAVAGVAAAIYFTSRNPEPVAVLVATRDLPAYHTITADDVRLSTREADADATFAALPVEGRLSLKPVAKDQPLRRGDVAPDVVRVLGKDLTVHGFTVPPSAVFADSLRGGARIRLLLVRDGRLLARLDAVVLSVAGSESASTRTLVVALRAKDAATNEVAVGTGTAVVLRDPGAADAPD